ncbi:chromatin assembly factor 1 subunit A [Galleria mellonella]|uniref:Chromatin assembly factor 1 subunit A n=1 Tax=Galleria mellonella TaxID=7137 RepID=A0ABM3MLQ5_GALME|nr:chromatin assembly factor 1 subunit A [Galleria mellonella]
MKNSKSPENIEVTPSKKKLKQARLPFKLISETSPSPVPPQTRKRKLSTPDPESVTKIGKISNENDLVDNLVVISDDDSKDQQVCPEIEKPINPYVKLVDTVFKKKQLQKSKKKKALKKRISKDLNVSVECNENDISINKSSGDEVMEVDLQHDNVTETVEKESHVKEDNSGPDCKQSPIKIDINISKDTCSSSKNVDTSKKDQLETINLEDECDSNVEVSKKYQNKQIINVDIEATIKSTCDTQNEEMSKNEETEQSLIEKKITNDKEASKRSTRNKVDEHNQSKTSNNFNETLNSNPTTPKHNRSSSANSHGNESLNESTTNLTPKQLQKKMESAKKKEEREKEKLERERKRQQEKDEKAKLRQEKEEQKKKEREEKEEAKRKEKEEKEEQKRKEREEKEKQKELERKLKEEKEDQKRKEKEEKEEQKRKEKEAREEEKRKKQEALELEKQEQELKKKKAAEAFVNFFVPKQKIEKDQNIVDLISKSSVLSSFTIKADMRLAPIVRTNLDESKRQELDTFLEKQDKELSALYLKELRSGISKPLSSGKTWPLDDKDDDVMIIEDELPPLSGTGEVITCDSAIREKLRPKLLSFHENRRPPYWGTWRKKSTAVKPRRPFGQDEKQLDYEVDSDEEWEEEQEGESIDGSAAGSDDEQDADEYEVDNEVFVPHGYLSDEEATMDEDDVLSLSPEAQQARLKHLEDEFESEMRKPTEKLKPRLYGLLWETSDGGKPEHCVDALWNYFGKLSMIMNDPTSLLTSSIEPEESEKKKVKKKKLPELENQSPKSDKKKKEKKEKESKPKGDIKKNTPEVKKNQPGINSFLTKIKS